MRYIRIGNKKSLLIAAILIVATGAFQNCSPAKFQRGNVLNVVQDSSGGLTVVDTNQAGPLSATDGNGSGGIVADSGAGGVGTSASFTLLPCQIPIGSNYCDAGFIVTTSGITDTSLVGLETVGGGGRGSFGANQTMDRSTLSRSRPGVNYSGGIAVTFGTTQVNLGKRPDLTNPTIASSLGAATVTVGCVPGAHWDGSKCVANN
jgi:hypothetical protein